MTEPELTPEIAATLFGGNPKTESEATTEQTTPTPTAEPPTEDTEGLDSGQVELMERYRLSRDQVQRVRGETWTERVADAKELAGLSDPQPINPSQHVLDAFSEHDAAKLGQHRGLIALLHPPTKKAEG